MKRKRRSKILIFILLFIAVACLITGFCFIGSWQADVKEDQRKSVENVEKVEKIIKETPKEEIKDAIPEGTLGIIYIPSFDNFSHVIAYGVDNDTLATYVGMYKTYSAVGENGLCVLASHSTMWTGREKYCFFNRIEDKVKVGDDVHILWNDGNTYNYTVVMVDAWVPKDQEADYFNKYNNPTKQTLILQTCTHGNGDYRSFVVCNRKD